MTEAVILYWFLWAWALLTCVVLTVEEGHHRLGWVLGSVWFLTAASFVTMLWLTFQCVKGATL